MGIDTQTMEQTFAQYGRTIYRLALQYTRQPPDAEDVLQEVLLERCRRTEPFQSPEHERRWLLRVTVNHCRDVLRSPWRKRRASLDELPPQPVFRQPEQEALYQSVMALPEIYRIVLVLFYYEELSVREIGALLKLETSAVTTRLSRARAKLKEQLGEVWQDE